MSSPRDKDRPEAARDTGSGKQGEGAHARDGSSGGHRSKAGSDYGDWVPERTSHEPLMGDYYTGGGNIDRVAEEPGSARADDQAAAPADKPGAADDQERVAEANRNKSFDTTHVHTSGSSRKV